MFPGDISHKTDYTSYPYGLLHKQTVVSWDVDIEFIKHSLRAPGFCLNMKTVFSSIGFSRPSYLYTGNAYIINTFFSYWDAL